MTKHSTMSILIHDMAEGSPDSSESREPVSPALPNPSFQQGAADLDRSHISAAETGLIPIIKLQAEGKDADKAQDAAKPTDETIPAKPKTTPAPAEKRPGLAKDKTPSVLIIEDTTELAEVIQATLERMNMITAHETHGGKALATYATMDPDVVLLDISLPDITGWKILDAIKEKREATNSQMPIIIVITAYGDPANRLVGKLQNVDSYLIKPFTADEVEKVVANALNNKAL